MKSILLAIAFLAGACATASSQTGTSRLSARVLTYRGGTATPVSGADVGLQCPNGMTRDLGKTGPDGLLVAEAALPSPDCKLVVGGDGYRTAKISVADACQQTTQSTCGAIDVSTVLQPTGSAGDVR